MSLIASLVFLAAPAGGGDQTPPVVSDKGDETVVTARKFVESLAGTPLSASAIDAHALETFRMVETHDLQARVPNLLFSEFSARRLSFPFMRGIGSGINDPAVLTYVDDVPQFGFGGTNLPLFALERVEVLRGPQGTLYGKNALGGLIHLHGQRPTDDPRSRAEGTFGSYDLREYSGGYAGPLGGGVRGDFALLSSKRDGFTENDFTGHDVDDRDGLFGRGRLLWSPSADSELDFTLFGERARDGGFVLSELNALRDDPHHIDQDFEGITDRDVLAPSLVYRLFGGDLDFTSISSFERWDVLETSDFDFSPIDGVRRRSEEDQHYYYQELRLGTAEAARKDAFAWQAGASGFLSDRTQESTNNFRPGGAGILFPPANVGKDLNHGEFDEHGAALFGQVSVPVGAVFTVEGGLRYDYEDKEIDRLHTFDPGIGPIVLGQGSEDDTFDQLVPMGSVSWHPAEAATVYARAAKGWKAGGFNLAAPAGKEQFDAETVWNYELGWRQSFADDRYGVGATVFYMDWQDMQLAQFDAVAGGYVTNAGKSTSQGVELEGRAALSEGLTGFATAGLLDTEIEEFVDAFGTDTSGNDLPFAPDTTWSLGLEYGGELPSGAHWSLAGDYQSMGDFFYDAGNREGDSFGIANFRLAADSATYGVSVWVRNAFDEDYSVVAFQPSPVDPNTFVGESGAPRVVGFTLSLHP